MSSESEVFFIQTAWVDAALDDPKSWETNVSFSFADRAYAERWLADRVRDAAPQPRMDLDRDPRVLAVLEQMRAERSLLGRLRRELFAMRKRFSRERDGLEEQENRGDPLFRVIGEIAAEAEAVEQVFRVVSSAELFAEGGEEALLRAERATAVLGTLSSDAHVSDQTRTSADHG